MKLLFVFAFTLIFSSGFCQKYTSEKASIYFFSHATIEDITANNIKATSIFNAATGDIVFSVPIKEFVFEKSLMKEHFNEKYMESEKYPKATFQGKLIGFQIEKVGVQQIKAQGELTIHGVTKQIEIEGTIELLELKMNLKSEFKLKLEDYNITRPQLLWQNIAEVMDVKADFNYISKL